MRRTGLEQQQPAQIASLETTVPRRTTWATPEPDPDLRIRIDSPAAVVFARQKGRFLARGAGFTSLDAALIATAVSELARCVLRRTGDGEVAIRLIESAEGRRGIVLRAHDEGRGLPDPQQAIREGQLGLGLRRVVQLMDEVQAASDTLRGTTITVTKWLASWRPMPGCSPS